jgi:sarcosine oxidase
MAEHFDAIVIGLGGFGGAAFDQLARRGLNVVGIEQFGVAHNRGSSHGETRIIRKAYFEHPDYVPLLLRAYDQWSDLERDFGRRVLHQVGLMIAGRPDGEAVAGARLARQLHGVPLEDVSRQDAGHRFPGFRIPEEFDVVFEPDAGFLEVENCVRAQVQRGVRAGGFARTNETVRRWSSDGATVRVETERGEYLAERAVIAAGAWAGAVLRDLRLPLEVKRKPVVWWPVRSNVYEVSRGAPTFYFEQGAQAFYGFPSTDGVTLKLAEHTGGDMVDNPATVDRALRDDDIRPLTAFIRERMPEVDDRPVRHSVCLYTLTPDRHFVVDQHPLYGNVAIAAGFSGHGFKFTPVIGEALADLVIDGETRLPIGFLGLNRFERTRG